MTQAEDLTWTQSPEVRCVSVLWFHLLFRHFRASVQYQSWPSSTLGNYDLRLFCSPVSPARCDHRGKHPSVPGLPSSPAEALPVCDKRWLSDTGDATTTPTINRVGGGKTLTPRRVARMDDATTTPTINRVGGGETLTPRRVARTDGAHGASPGMREH